MDPAQTKLNLTRAVLRPWKHDDLESLVAHANDADIARYMGPMPFPYTAEHAASFLNGILTPPANDNPKIVWAVEVEGAAAGCISATCGSGIRHRNAELGYWLGRAHWGRGIISEAVGAALPIFFEQLNLERLSASVFSPNAASARVLEKNGFHVEATLQRMIDKGAGLWDEIIYARFRSTMPNG